MVKRALATAREPILYQDLVEALLSTTPSATPEKVEQLITELWQQTLLLTDLRPPLTIESPVRYVIERLIGIPSAKETLAQLEFILEATATYDVLPPEEGITAYQRLVTMANEVNKIQPKRQYKWTWLLHFVVSILLKRSVQRSPTPLNSYSG